jgi:hypothetical protein
MLVGDALPNQKHGRGEGGDGGSGPPVGPSVAHGGRKAKEGEEEDKTYKREAEDVPRGT